MWKVTNNGTEVLISISHKKLARWDIFPNITNILLLRNFGIANPEERETFEYIKDMGGNINHRLFKIE
jgi:hypothetical protein